MGYSAKKIVQTAVDTVNEKYGKVWYRRYNKFQNDASLRSLSVIFQR